MIIIMLNVYNRTVRLQGESGVGRKILSLLKSVWISLNSDQIFRILTNVKKNP